MGLGKVWQNLYVCPFLKNLCWTINWWLCKQNITWLRQSMRKRKRCNRIPSDITIGRNYAAWGYIYWDREREFQKRGITPEPLCQTSQNKYQAHLFFIYIMYINFHLDALTTVVKVLDWKRQRKDDLSPVFAMLPRYLIIVENTEFKTWHNGAHDANLLMMIRWSYA